MQPSFHTAPQKPEKGTKGNTERIEKKDPDLAQDRKPLNDENKPDKNKKN